MARKYSTSYKSRRGSTKILGGVSFSAPLFMTEEEKLIDKIERDEKFIETYEADYGWLADEARSRLRINKAKLVELQEKKLSDLEVMLGDERATIVQMDDYLGINISCVGDDDGKQKEPRRLSKDHYDR